MGVLEYGEFANFKTVGRVGLIGDLKEIKELNHAGIWRGSSRRRGKGKPYSKSMA